jgi:hypothetical protein
MQRGHKIYLFHEDKYIIAFLYVLSEDGGLHFVHSQSGHNIQH